MLRVMFSAINRDKKKRIASRLIALGISAYLLTLIAPTMADEMIPPPADVVVPVDVPPADPSPAAVAPTDTPAPIASPAAAPNTDPTADPTPVASASASPSPTPTKPPPHAIANQVMQIQAPTVLRVDPRARSLFLPQISVFNASGILLVCINGANMGFDVNTKNLNDAELFNKDTFAGDYTSFVRFAGSTGFSNAVLNNDGGLRAFSYSNGVAGKYVLLRFVSISEPSVNPALCNDGSASNTRIVQIAPLGIDLDMKKGDVTLKR